MVLLDSHFHFLISRCQETKRNKAWGWGDNLVFKSKWLSGGPGFYSQHSHSTSHLSVSQVPEDMTHYLGIRHAGRT